MLNLLTKTKKNKENKIKERNTAQKQINQLKLVWSFSFGLYVHSKLRFTLI